jgi:hypothetical protein
MKLNLVKDKSGKVIASYENPHRGGASITPVLEDGHTVHEVEVEENYLHNVEAVFKRNSN